MLRVSYIHWSKVNQIQSLETCSLPDCSDLSNPTSDTYISPLNLQYCVYLEVDRYTTGLYIGCLGNS